METGKNRRRPRPINIANKRPPTKKSWISENLKILFVISVFLFIGQSFRGCINTSSLKREIKMMENINDSIVKARDKNINDLQTLLGRSQNDNRDLIYELKIAGIKADEAEKRALAIQSTAEKIKQNTTITIEADTTRNKIN